MSSKKNNTHDLGFKLIILKCQLFNPHLMAILE
jgi:hypothetical protein